MGHELHRMADHSIRLRTGGRCSGERESGLSKGVLLTHVNLVNNARFFADHMHLTEQDRVLHHGGLHSA
jgi:acyl-CoA synthetase (AMP-forming)/AMP-acid ligase II